MIRRHPYWVCALVSFLVLTAASSCAAQTIRPGPKITSSSERRRQEILDAGRVQKFAPMPWAKAIVKETAHYHIRTNTSEATAKYLAVLLEELYKFYGQRLGKYPTQKLNIYVFATRADFQRELAKTGIRVGPGVGGMYVHGGRRTGIYLPWVMQGRLDPASVLMHEGFHQFFHTVFRTGQPIWLNEGMAVYFENCKFDGEKLHDAYISNLRLGQLQRVMKAKRHGSLKRLLGTPQYAFGPMQYAQAWSFVYWMAWGQGSRSKNDTMQRRFVAYLDYLKKKGDFSPGGFEKATGLRLDRIQPEWEAWVLSLDPRDPFGGKGDPQRRSKKIPIGL